MVNAYFCFESENFYNQLTTPAKVFHFFCEKENHGQNLKLYRTCDRHFYESLTVPRELWRMVDHLYKFAMDEKGLFASSGVAAEVSVSIFSHKKYLLSKLFVMSS